MSPSTAQPRAPSLHRLEGLAKALEGAGAPRQQLSPDTSRAWGFRAARACVPGHGQGFGSQAQAFEPGWASASLCRARQHQALNIPSEGW